MAEATEALLADSGIRTPPAGMKYVIAVLFVLLTTFAFYRGEPAPDIDSAFVAANLVAARRRVRRASRSSASSSTSSRASVSSAWCSASVDSMPAVQRGRAVGNGDYLPEYDAVSDRWLAVARLRFVPDRQEEPLRWRAGVASISDGCDDSCTPAATP